ncbi:hypothetical protein CYR55_17845 [Chimaeribacter californicus]|uniref:Uncharacterized protein n=1 Tax=Chimaeribacter californicus TaxID=2060067 RepID=A0A2N5DZB5_9GAMM|nr:hypothetical protein [Chimaeribacter californicus]PLR33068.1 hypothetical protein CYR55_17845 [Chimaeribacter californicus]
MFHSIYTHHEQVIFFLFSVVLGGALPVGIYIGRKNIRAIRSALLLELDDVFGLSAKKSIPSMEVMKYKYNVNEEGNGNTADEDGVLVYYIVPVVLYTCLATGCFYISLHTIYHVYKMSVEDLKEGEYLSRMVFTFTFLGAYLWTMQYLLRRVANFDLSPVSYFRAFFRILLPLVIVGAIYYSGVMNAEIKAAENSVQTAAAPAPGATGTAPAAVTADRTAPETAQTPSDNKQAAVNKAGSTTLMIVAIALLVGLFPLAFIDVLIARFPYLALRRVYKEDKRLMKDYPLDMIIGIDPYMKFRLEEFEIGDVQNLATANPIQLFVETPYGLYEIMDWIAQAQLIIAVGSKKTLQLRELNIRTVFDLLLIGPNHDLRTRLYRILLGDPAVELMAIPDSCPLSKQSCPISNSGDALDNMINLICSDLYIARLWQIWRVIYQKISESESASLPSPPNAILTKIQAGKSS